MWGSSVSIWMKGNPGYKGFVWKPWYGVFICIQMGFHWAQWFGKGCENTGGDTCSTHCFMLGFLCTSRWEKKCLSSAVSCRKLGAHSSQGCIQHWLCTEKWEIKDGCVFATWWNEGKRNSSEVPGSRLEVKGVLVGDSCQLIGGEGSACWRLVSADWRWKECLLETCVNWLARIDSTFTWVWAWILQDGQTGHSAEPQGNGQTGHSAEPEGMARLAIQQNPWGNGQTCQTGNSAEPQGNGKTGLSSEPQGKAIVVKMLDLVSKPSCILHLVAVYQSVLTSVHSWASMQQSHFQ